MRPAPDFVLCLALSVALVVVPGCSMFAQSTQTLAITASDHAAEIYVDGQLVGTGTAAIPVARDRSHAVMARVDDRSGVAAIGTKMSTLGVLDIIGGIFFLVPFIGLAFPGSRELEMTAVAISIPPK